MHKCGYTTNIVSINIWHALANMSGSGANNSSTTTQIESSEVFRNFIDSLDSEVTKRSYRYSINYFMSFLSIGRYEDLVSLNNDTKKLEGFIRDYITCMRQDRKLSPATVSVRIAAISHFYSLFANFNKLAQVKKNSRGDNVTL